MLKVQDLMNILIVLILLGVGMVFSQDESSLELAPRIFLYKYTPTNPVVESRDFVITYQLINSGNAVAGNIEIADNYDINSFDMVDNVDAEGFVSQRFDELPPSGQMSFNVTVRPKLHGVYESTRARIRYINSATSEENAEDVKQGYSTSLGRTRIVSSAEYEHSISYFVKEWLLVLLLCLVPILLPYYMYSQVNSRMSVFTTQYSKGKSKSE